MLLEWIKRHKILMSIFGVVLVLCIILSISYSRGNLGAIGSGVQTANSVTQAPVTKGVNWIKDSTKGIFRFRAVVRENQELQDRLEELNKENIKLKLDEQELAELKELSLALNYEAVKNSQGHVTGDITTVNGASYFNTFTIDCGTEKGIAKDNIVVNGTGLVGMVRETGRHFSKISSIIDKSSSVSYRVLNKMDIMGIVNGGGNGMLEGYTFDMEAEISEGDVLITSGMGVYPAGIVIGTVESVSFNQGTQLKTITVKPAVSFNSIKKVLVLI